MPSPYQSHSEELNLSATCKRCGKLILFGWADNGRVLSCSCGREYYVLYHPAEQTLTLEYPEKHHAEKEPVTA